MSMTDTVRSSMMAAMKNKDKLRKDALSALLSALRAKEIDNKEALSDDEAYRVIKKEIKQLNETMESAPAGYEELKSECQKKIEVLSEFLPRQMSEEEIKQTIEKVIHDLGLENPGPKQKGIIMKSLMPLVKGKADGKKVNEILSGFLVA